MAISTSLTKRLGIEHPVMLAPMGFVSRGALAAAVSAGGGFGIIGGGIARGYGWPPQYTGRAVHNRFSETWHGREKALAQDEAERTRYAELAASGDADIAVVFASEGIDLIHAIEPASVILAQVLQEAEAALARSLSIAV